MKTFKLLPEFKTEVKCGMFNCIVEIENDYLQAWADAGAFVMATGGDYWIMTEFGQLWLKIRENEIHLECIAVMAEDRRQGKGRELMGYVTEISDETGTQVSLQVSDVTAGGYIGMPHPVVGHGQVKKDKIPVRSLPKWYESLGFKKTPEYTEKKRTMIYTPKKK